MTYAGFGAQSTKVAPLIANGAEPPPLTVKSQRLADSRAISAGSRGLAARRGCSARAFIGSPSDAIATNGRSASPASPRRSRRTPAPSSRGISNINSNRAPGPMGNWLLSGSKGSLGWPSTATMRIFAPLIATVARRAVAALPRRSLTRAPGRALSFNGAVAPLAKTTPPLRPLPRPMAGSAKSSLIWPLASTFQSDSATAASRSTSGAFGSSTMIGPKSPRPCWEASVGPARGR